MNRRHDRMENLAKPRKVVGNRSHLNAFKLIVCGLVVLTIIAAGAWFWTRHYATAVPVIDLRNLDAAVAGLIQKNVDEVSAHPRSAAAWGNLGSVLRNYHLSAPAQQCLAEAERLDSTNPRWPYLQSLLLISEAPETALAKLRRTVQLCGNEPEAPRLRLATLLAEAGRWNEVEPQIDELLRAKPDFGPALLLQARQAQAQGDFAEAIRKARRCVGDPRTTRSALILLSSLYGRQGDTTAASQAAQHAAILPADETVADPYQAEAAVLRIDPRMLTEQTHPLLAAGRLKEAEQLIDRLLREHGDYAETWLLVGRLQLLKKEFAGAEQSLRHHLQLDPQSSQGLFQLGMVQMAQERFPEAAETFLKATQLKSDFGPAFYNRGYALARSGRAQESRPDFREAIRLNPERIDSYLMLADIALRLGERAEAAQRIQQAEALNPSHPGVRQLKEKMQDSPPRP